MLDLVPVKKRTHTQAHNCNFRSGLPLGSLNAAHYQQIVIVDKYVHGIQTIRHETAMSELLELVSFFQDVFVMWLHPLLEFSNRI